MNKMVDINKQYTIKDGIVDSNYIRVIAIEEWSFDYRKDDYILKDKKYKLQIKIHGFLLSKYHTIKTYAFDINDEAADLLAKNEAIELFNNIINPYNCYG